MIYILGAGGIARETFDIYKDLDRFEELIRFVKEIRNNIGNCEVFVGITAKLLRKLK